MKTLLLASVVALASLSVQANDMTGHGSQEQMADMGHQQAQEVAGQSSHMSHDQEQQLTTATGEVRKLDLDNGVAIIAHEPVPALGWPAMVMPFKVSEEAMASLEEGATITFDFSPDNTMIQAIH